MGIQVFMENGINNPILYYPVFYTIKDAVENVRAFIDETPFCFAQ